MVTEGSVREGVVAELCEALWEAETELGLLSWETRGVRLWEASRVAAYFALYAAFRVAIEPLRGDALRGVFLGGALSTSQFVGAAVLASCLAWLAVGRWTTVRQARLHGS